MIKPSNTPKFGLRFGFDQFGVQLAASDAEDFDSEVPGFGQCQGFGQLLGRPVDVHVKHRNAGDKTALYHIFDSIDLFAQHFL